MIPLTFGAVTTIENYRAVLANDEWDRRMKDDADWMITPALQKLLEP